MTVKELREALDGWGDDVKVLTRESVSPTMTIIWLATRRGELRQSEGYPGAEVYLMVS